ncbi:MAG: hypothetical protein P4L90_23985 [Rhodopila sp.]|nr:hypothetical protein [Rhodopila sp.]
MTLRLRNNALALARMQLSMLALARAEPAQPVIDAPPPAGTGPQVMPGQDEAATACPNAPEPDPEPAEPLPLPDHLPSGDALSRFVSRRLEPDESPHEVWQQLHETEHRKRPRNPALPRAGFRSPPD